MHTRNRTLFAAFFTVSAAHLAKYEKVFTANVKEAVGKQTCPNRLPTGRAS